MKRKYRIYNRIEGLTRRSSENEEEVRRLAIDEIDWTEKNGFSKNEHFRLREQGLYLIALIQNSRSYEIRTINWN